MFSSNDSFTHSYARSPPRGGLLPPNHAALTSQHSQRLPTPKRPKLRPAECCPVQCFPHHPPALPWPPPGSQLPASPHPSSDSGTCGTHIAAARHGWAQGVGSTFAWGGSPFVPPPTALLLLRGIKIKERKKKKKKNQLFDLQALMEAEGRSARDEQRQRIRLQGSQKKASKGTDSAPGKAGGEGPMATPPGEPQLLTTQARRWQQRGAGLPAPGTPRERGAVPSSARRKPQPVEQEGARGGRAGGRRRGEMPRRVLCMLSSPRRSIWHGWLSARAGPACPGERSLSAHLPPSRGGTAAPSPAWMGAARPAGTPQQRS